MEQIVAKDVTMRLWVMGNNNGRRGDTKLTERDPFGLRNLPMDVANSESEQRDIFYTNMAPALEVLRAMGALPIQTLRVNRNSFSGRRLTSPVMLWSASMYAGLLTALWFAYSQGFVTTLNSQSFETTLIGYLDLAYHLIDLAVPFNNWREARLVAQYMASWSAFQSHYRVVTGRSLEVNFRRRAVVLTVVLVMVTCGRETMYQVLENNLDNYLVLLTYWYQALLRDTMGLTWYLLCSLLQKTAQSLTTSFQKDVDTAVRPSLVIARYNTLWLQLSRVARQTGIAMCYTYGFYVLYLFLMTTVSMYGLISCLEQGIEQRVIYLAGDSLITGTELFIVCDGANSVTREVGLTFQGKLLDIRNAPISDKVEKEVDAFLRAIELRPPEINFGGYVTVNRGMLLSLGSMMVTYLVVLLQLDLSKPQILRDAVNVTSPTTTDDVSA
ncbi:gustatory and odorant receptor 24-like [Zootermopsis nevadensis]|uniref:Gustatory receptor n=1 Tax=Zootermopsis nevadensis TaxID=136037 RepID=A0A067R7N6_ZOONE|nr:gustatory and odorant receptor 24-like [Zootermopsis nevadensis]XP_021929495.1 gustatory and odorant receptor 24-like [Zootermopsis nevadensis]KDR14353.1 hypothetical protein L798_10385 [Zootermopsis nevadensis]